MSFNGKGALQGGAQGAAAGSSAGPWGAAIGAIGGAAIGAFSSNSSAKKSYKYASRLQAQAAQLNYDYAKKSALNSPSWNREGLESAGYNPMLAVQNSTSGANSSWTSANSSTGFDMSQGMSAGVANAQSVQRLKNETQVADNTSKKLEAEGENLNADTANKLEENKYIGEKRKKEIANIQVDTLEKEARIDNMKKQIELGWAGVNVQQEANAVSERNNKRTNRVNTSLEHIKHPYSSWFHKVYTSSKDYKGSYSDPWSN